MDVVLAELSPAFDEMYAENGRPSIPPERLLKATLLMAFYSVRSERLFCEQLDYNLLFRWFLDMDMVEPGFDPSTFSKNRQRLIEADIAKRLFFRVVEQARKAHLLSHEHFTVGGTLIEAWAPRRSSPARPTGRLLPLTAGEGVGGRIHRDGRHRALPPCPFETSSRRTEQQRSSSLRNRCANHITPGLRDLATRPQAR